MVKPEPFDLNELISLHREEFVKFELWVSDELTEHLIHAFDLDPSYTTVVVDLDEEEPIAGGSGGVINLRLNGRFYMPRHDKKGVELEVSMDEWAEKAQEWFDENKVDVEMETPEDLIKFTAFVEGITLPEGMSTGDEAGGEAGDEGKADEPIGDEEEPLDETGEEGESLDEDIDDEPPGEDEEGLKEFEKSLGL